jgi:hypothetical protein
MTSLQTTMAIERDDSEIIVTLTGTYHRRCVGRKAHPMDRFAPPDDPACIEDMMAYKPNGTEIDLDEAEWICAEILLMEAAEEQLQPQEP